MKHYKFTMIVPTNQVTLFGITRYVIEQERKRYLCANFVVERSEQEAKEKQEEEEEEEEEEEQQHKKCKQYTQLNLRRRCKAYLQFHVDKNGTWIATKQNTITPYTV